MERKIGEIFEYNGEWYQCLPERNICDDCAFKNDRTCKNSKEIRGECQRARRQKDGIIFKKLEKVGEPFYSKFFGKFYQMYKTYIPAVGSNFKIRVTPVEYVGRNEIFIEIKQNKEDMEEKKLIELLSEKVHNAWMKEKEAQGFSYGKDYDKEKKKHPDMLPYNELKEEVKEYDRATVRAVLQAQKEMQSKYNYNTLKSFDLKAAKAGKPICTRDGRKARIICFDVKAKKPIAALITNDDTEEAHFYYDNGRSDQYQKYRNDLMMLPEKKEGWVNVYKRENEYICENECNVSTGIAVYKSEDEAKRNINKNEIYVNTIKINWEE